ncbi:endo alpha-1,4 polygalactosaminidase [Niveibacterium microcysteis]|uniref:Endo alpha-1,4 polygalactosaminidase n=1 Tax=Niveibacterium microcysteis TaxID=2811415 RepID=A0ABX7MA83_9RHOO|nr:endo alpha-1,4 polygalactosaminidase [Niveibacterium microcysteis]QSI77806.1 endo alpha-1,4 polygalactosaminidase [Niveibacterium microcysteis]
MAGFKLSTRRGASVLIGLALLALGACGGGGSDSTAPAPSQPDPAPPVSGRWVPALSDTWQWQLNGSLNTSYVASVYDVDLFDTPQTTIDALHAQNRKVVCYFSAGSGEDWRPDYGGFAAADLGAALAGWAGERWLDTRSASVRSLMAARLDLAVSKRCDGVESDNVDGYANTSGFPLSAATQLDYNRWLAAQAHARKLAIALKNDLEQLPDLQGDFDFAINEECFALNECSAYASFIALGKPVFNAEYASRYQQNTNGARTALCAAAQQAQIRTLVLAQQLDDSYRYACP